MAIKVLYELESDVPDAFRDHVKQDKVPVIDAAGKKTMVEKWVVDVEDIEGHPKILSLKNAYKSEQDKRKTQGEKLKEAEEKLQLFPDDFDVEKWNLVKNVTPGDADKQRQELRAALESQFKKEKEALEADGKKKQAFIEKILKQDRLRDGLISAKVNPDLLPGAMALLSQRVQIKAQGDEFVDVVDTDMGPITAKEYAIQWVQSDEGKPYVKAPEGPSLRGGDKTNLFGEKNPWAKDTFNLTEQIRLKKEDAAKAARLQAAAQGNK